ncbi:hypothetical protein OIU77_008901 [Salix suchowensis]|uniref:Uncharacterized protein n=1 Tax=Salix suchowensis TaxID=1278906 RepID=A0ABQ9ACI2_9ROSI|nr:hypothetical protein OIU77_008901 [Salix suchowensis]
MEETASGDNCQNLCEKANEDVRVCDDYMWILPEILQCTSNLEVFVLILDEDAYDWNWRAPHSAAVFVIMSSGDRV